MSFAVNRGEPGVAEIVPDGGRMGEESRAKLKKRGREVKIYPLANLHNQDVIEINDNCQIDDLTFIDGGTGLKIGRYVHIACGARIVGGGHLQIGDYAVIGYGSTIITGSEDYRGGKRMSSLAPREQRNPRAGQTTIGRDVYIGAHVVVHPDVKIGEGAIIGSSSLVLKDIEPWSINVGNPCRRIGKRPPLMVDAL